MENKFKDTYRLKISDYTNNDLLAPHGVLDLFQDIAGKHANSFHMSYEELLSENKLWIILRNKYKVIHNVKLYSKVTVETWAKPKGLVDFDRETVIYDEDGNKMIVGISKWVIIDLNTRRILPAKHLDYKAPLCGDSNFIDKFDKLKDFDIDGLDHYQERVKFCDTDHNGHCNNVRYASMVLNAIKPYNEIVDEFQIDYIHETMIDDIIDIYYKKIDDIYYLKGISNNKSVFLCKIKTIKG